MTSTMKLWVRTRMGVMIDMRAMIDRAIDRETKLYALYCNFENTFNALKDEGERVERIRDLCREFCDNYEEIVGCKIDMTDKDKEYGERVLKFEKAWGEYWSGVYFSRCEVMVRTLYLRIQWVELMDALDNMDELRRMRTITRLRELVYPDDVWVEE